MILSDLNKKRSKISFDVIIPVFCLTLLSLLLIFSDLELTFQANFYNSETGWFLKDAQPWKFIYHYGNIPALILIIGALFILALSPYLAKLNKQAKRALYLILVMAIGPGLLVNVLLKDNWGRPRPRNISEFGGKQQYEKVLIIDPDSPGKSFPCGHCSMGFYFFALYFILRKNKKKLAATALGLTLIWGGLIGFARIVQGGHFLSDVIWTAGLVYLTSYWIYRFMRLDTRPEYLKSFQKKSTRSRLIAILSSLLIIVAVILVSLATPYSRDKFFIPDQKFDVMNDQLQANFQILDSDIVLRTGEDLRVNFNATGFGFPKSRIITKFQTFRSDSNFMLSFEQSLKGFFTELQQENVITVPQNLRGELSLNSTQADLTIYLPENSNWIILPTKVEKIIDPSGYLNNIESIAQQQDRILYIKVNLSSGTLRILR